MRLTSITGRCSTTRPGVGGPPGTVLGTQGATDPLPACALTVIIPEIWARAGHVSGHLRGLRLASRRSRRSRRFSETKTALLTAVAVPEVQRVVLSFPLSDTHGCAVLHRAADGEVGRSGDELLREGDLLAPGSPGAGHHRRICHRARLVRVLDVVGPGQRRRVGLGHHPPEPLGSPCTHAAAGKDQRRIRGR